MEACSGLGGGPLDTSRGPHEMRGDARDAQSIVETSPGRPLESSGTQELLGWAMVLEVFRIWDQVGSLGASGDFGAPQGRSKPSSEVFRFPAYLESLQVTSGPPGAAPQGAPWGSRGLGSS